MVVDRVFDALLQLGDRVLEHLLIEFVAHFLDVSGLLVAEQVARAADVEVVGGQLEAGAERVERLQHLEAALGLHGQRPVRRHREEGVGARLRAADAPA